MTEGQEEEGEVAEDEEEEEERDEEEEEENDAEEEEEVAVATEGKGPKGAEKDEKRRITMDISVEMARLVNQKKRALARGMRAPYGTKSQKVLNDTMKKLRPRLRLKPKLKELRWLLPLLMAARHPTQKRHRLARNRLRRRPLPRLRDLKSPLSLPKSRSTSTWRLKSNSSSTWA